MFREKEEMSLTEKTDIRDSDEKVVEIEMERLDKKKCKRRRDDDGDDSRY